MLIDDASRILALLRSSKLANVAGHPVVIRSSLSPDLAPVRREPRLKLLLAFAAIYLIWGSTYLGIRYAVETIPPLCMMGIRHLTAGVVLYAWVRARGAAAPTVKHWGYAAVAGVLLFLGGHGSLAWAEQRVPSGLAALLSATLPLWVVVLGRMVGSEQRLHWQVITGVLLGFAGVALLTGWSGFGSGSTLEWLSAGAVLLATFLWAAGTMYVHRVPLPGDSVLSSAMQMVFGGATLLAAGGLSGEIARFHVTAMTMKSMLSLAYLIVFGSLVAFTAFTWLNRASTPTRVSTYAYVNPVVAVLLGWVFAGEPIGWRTLVAMPIILSGVALVNRGRRRSPTSQEERMRVGNQMLQTGENC